MLGRGVNAATRQANPPNHRRFVHNGAAIFKDGWNLVLHAEQRPKYVDVENLPAILLGLLIGRQANAFNAGIVEGEIEPPQGRNRLIHEGFDIGYAAHICFHEQGFAAAVFNGFHRFATFIFASPRNDNLGSCHSQRQGRSFTYSRSSICHKRHFISNDVFIFFLSLLRFRFVSVAGFIPMTL
jgi:hypothetical protein